MTRRFKCASALLCAVCLLPLAVCSASAIESNIDAYREEFALDDLYDGVDDETKDLLEAFGVSDVNLASLYAVSPRRVLDALLGVAGNVLREPLLYLAAAALVAALTAGANAFSSSPEAVQTVGGCVLALLAAAPAARTVTAAFSALEVVGGFSVAFAGVFCAVISAAGGVASASTYAGFTAALGTLLTEGFAGFARPAVNALSSAAFFSAFDVFTFSEKLSGLVKKTALFILGLSATLYAGLLSAKGLLAAGSDSVASRGVRFLIGKSVPVVGGAVSESLSAVMAGLSVIRGTVGVFGILTFVLTVLPTFLSLCAWSFAFTASAALCETFGCGRARTVPLILRDALEILAVLFVLCALVFTVGVGIMLREVKP